MHILGDYFCAGHYHIVLIISDIFTNVWFATEHAKVLMKFESYSMKS